MSVCRVMYVCVCVCMYVCMYVCVYVCMLGILDKRYLPYVLSIASITHDLAGLGFPYIYHVHAQSV